MKYILIIVRNIDLIAINRMHELINDIDTLEKLII